MGKILSSKYGQKLFDTTTSSATDALKTARKTAIQKIAVATGYSVGNKTADEIVKAATKIQTN